MNRRSVRQVLRCIMASRWSRCALFALGWCLFSLALPVYSAESPAVQPLSLPLLDEPNPLLDNSKPADAKSVDAKSADPDAQPPRVPSEASLVEPSSDGAASSAPAVSGSLAAALERPGDLTLRNSSLADALFTIGELWGINIVAGDVKGAVNGVFKDAPLREILDSILLSNGYGYRPVGESLVVSPVNDLGTINPFFDSATIPVYSADIDEVVDGARLLSTPQGQVQPMKSARSVFVLDYPDRVQLVRQFVNSIDSASRRSQGVSRSGLGQPLEVGYFRTQYIPAKTAEEALQAVISKDGRIGVLVKEDRIIVTDYAENLAIVEKVLKRIDFPRPQVRITALIYDLSLEDIEDLGINWNSAVGGDPVFRVDSVMKVPFDITPTDPFVNSTTTTDLPTETGSALTFLNLSPHFDLRAVVHALQTAKDSRLLANPHVAVLENELAVFQSVEEIPYQQLTQTQQAGQIGTTAFKDAGITLRVRPKIAADGTIEMLVEPEFSRLTGFTPGDNQPIFDRRTASTTLRIANRQTVVIGGLRQRDDVGEFKGVPYLKDVRYVGRFFRARDTTVKERELVVFIMPEIIGPADPMNCRNQLVADTTNYRLDQIPEAEGCPPGYDPEHCGMDGMPLPSEQDPAESLPQPKTHKDASTALQFPQDLPSDDSPARTRVAQGGLRRLPPVGQSDSLVPKTAQRPSDSVQSAASQPADKLPLRPDYDSRFRDAGGVQPQEHRVNETAPPEEEKKSFWRRYLPF